MVIGLRDLIEQSNAKAMYRYEDFPGPGQCLGALAAHYPKGAAGLHVPEGSLVKRVIKSLGDSIAAGGAKALLHGYHAVKCYNAHEINIFHKTN